MAEKEIGKVMVYYDKIKVIAIELTSSLKVGDKIHVKGATTDFTQTISSMQVEHEKVEKVQAGSSVGIKIKDKARVNDKVYKVS